MAVWAIDRVAQLAWCAGLFDGEGCITNSRHVRPQLAMQMCDEDTVRRFHETIGVGHVNGPYHPKGGRNPTWSWVAAKQEDVGAVLMTLYPLLCDRRQERARRALVDWRRPKRTKQKRTHCLKGHALTTENTYVAPGPRANRTCRTCTRNRRLA